MTQITDSEFGAEEGQKIIAFTKVELSWGWLGNMSPHPLEWEGKRWPTSEALFQAMRFPEGSPVCELVRLQKSPMAAKMVARKHRAERSIEPQSAADVELMHRILRMKVEQHCAAVEFRRQWETLLGMGDVLIIEDCILRLRGSGLFWGAALVDPVANRWRGRNCLGELWMKLVNAYRSERGQNDAAGLALL
jgi:predicted NAD-dependent protein-ADP-ribosyltransferase YbiA (DUF1768 family)